MLVVELFIVGFRELGAAPFSIAESVIAFSFAAAAR